MKPVKHVLNEVWEQYPDALAQDSASIINPPKLERILADIFVMGKYYYYVLEVASSNINNFHADILTLHPLKDYPTHLKDIIDLIHPDDLPFVVEAETWSFKRINAIGAEHILNLKSGYCFRMKVAENKYELFHHQAIHTAKDEMGRLIQTINIHTNIQHITTVNNYIVTVSGVGYRNDFYQKCFKVEKIEDTLEERLTKRELEILLLLTRSYTDKEIASVLNISYHTVRTHHKNILKKTKSKNSIELIKRSLENGYL